MRNTECPRETRHTRRFKKSTPTNKYTAVILQMVMSVSTATADRPYSAVLHLKKHLRSIMTTECMSGLALMHVLKDRELDAKRIIHQFSHQKNSRIALLFSP